jgi:hypothetical protein
MTAAILAILAAVIPLVVWLVRRSIEKSDDPKEQHRKRVESAESAIAKGDADALSANLASMLQRLREAKGLTVGQGGSSGPGGPAVQRKD